MFDESEDEEEYIRGYEPGSEEIVAVMLMSQLILPKTLELQDGALYRSYLFMVLPRVMCADYSSSVLERNERCGDYGCYQHVHEHPFSRFMTVVLNKHHPNTIMESEDSYAFNWHVHMLEMFMNIPSIKRISARQPDKSCPSRRVYLEHLNDSLTRLTLLGGALIAAFLRHILSATRSLDTFDNGWPTTGVTPNDEIREAVQSLL